MKRESMIPDSGPLTLRILSDLPRLDGVTTKAFLAKMESIGTKDTFWEGAKLFFRAPQHDLILLNSNTRRMLALCVLKWIFPFLKCRLVVVDVHLTKPSTWFQWAASLAKRLALRKVDHFIHYFPDFSKYDTYYGIGNRSSYVPFKVNYWESISSLDGFSSDGEYIFTAGRSFRDIPTYVEAMRKVPYPGMFLWEEQSVMKEFGAGLGWGDLPKNLHVQPHDGNKSWIDYIRKAKLVVVPVLTDALYAPGLSLYPMAMALKKCVIITEGASTVGILKGNEAIIVPPNDPLSMANAIKTAWEDDELRERIASAGRRYAQTLQGELRLLSDLVDTCGLLVARMTDQNGEASVNH